MYAHISAVPSYFRPIAWPRPARLFPRRPGMGDFTTVANTIVNQEGTSASMAPLNNPGNLIYAGQAGATPVTVNGVVWASWPTWAQGFQALLNQIALDASRGLSILQFTSKYAPAGQGANDPVGYANTIAAATGLSPSDPLAAADFPAPAVSTVPDYSSLFSDSAWIALNPLT